MQAMGGADPAYLQSIYGAKMASGDIGGGQSSLSGVAGGTGMQPRAVGTPSGSNRTSSIGYADGGMVQNPYNNFASPNQQGFMSYQGQGQPNQPYEMPPVLSQQTPQVMNNGGPDLGGSYAGNNMGYDNSGSDGGVGGQPTQMQTPLQQGNKPLGLGQFQQPQGLQIQGNPTSQVVQRPQQR